MKNLIAVIALIAFIEILHAIFTQVNGIKIVRKVDFIIHKTGSSLVVASFLSDYGWNLVGTVIAVAVYWFVRANRYYLKAMCEAVWNTYGKDALKQAAKKTQKTMQSKIHVPVVAAEENNPANDSTVEMVEEEPEEEEPEEEEPINPVDLFVSEPVEDVDIDI